LPGLPPKGDPFDWIQAGGSAAKLWELVEGNRSSEEVNGHADPFNLVCLNDVDPVPVDWLWMGYLAVGKVTLLGGDPDLGKSLICIDAAARQSKGINWPRGSHARVGSTIFICSEVGIADTIRPRAEAAGAGADSVLCRVPQGCRSRCNSPAKGCTRKRAPRLHRQLCFRGCAACRLLCNHGTGDGPPPAAASKK
jgi:hypothetical protein